MRIFFEFYIAIIVDRKRNTDIINIIQYKVTLESRIVKAALSFFGHVVRSDMMELQIMLGRMEVRRGRGRPSRPLHLARQSTRISL